MLHWSPASHEPSTNAGTTVTTCACTTSGAWMSGSIVIEDQVCHPERPGTVQNRTISPPFSNFQRHIMALPASRYMKRGPAAEEPRNSKLQSSWPWRETAAREEDASSLSGIHERAAVEAGRS